MGQKVVKNVRWDMPNTVGMVNA